MHLEGEFKHDEEVNLHPVVTAPSEDGNEILEGQQIEEAEMEHIEEAENESETPAQVADDELNELCIDTQIENNFFRKQLYLKALQHPLKKAWNLQLQMKLDQLTNLNLLLKAS